MVWWIHYDPRHRRSGAHFGLKTKKDIVYQTVNLMYDCHEESYDKYDINSLIKIGVNIFNIDMTIHNFEFLERIKASVQVSLRLPGMIPSVYYTPVGVSVTMSVNDPILLDDSVDIIIIKDVTKLNQLREFKKLSEKYSSTPILFWPPSLEIEELYELIKISDGMVLDPSMSSKMKFTGFTEVLEICKEARKPVFYMHPTIVEEYYSSLANDRRLLIEVQDIIEHRLDGMIIVGNKGPLPLELIQALIRAIEITERDFHVASNDYFNMSLQLKIPVLQPYAVALGACIAALQSGAKAIIMFTRTGASARVLSCAAPPCRVIAITRYEKPARRMHLYRKVMPLLYHEERANSWQDECIARLGFGTQFGLDTGLFKFGAKLVVLTPSEEDSMYCNSVQIASVSRIIQTFKCAKMKCEKMKCAD